MAKREEKRALNEQLIYDTALDLFCERGYDEVTLIDIATEADISTRTLYRYFPTKDAILQKFCKENMLTLKEYATGLDSSIPLKDRVLMIMSQDFTQMFGLFDPGYVLHCSRNNRGVHNRFEFTNVFELESIYARIFRDEQIANGIAPNTAPLACAAVITGLYRHCNDIYRFINANSQGKDDFQKFCAKHLDVIWGSIQARLICDRGEEIDPKEWGFLGNVLGYRENNMAFDLNSNNSDKSETSPN